MEISTFIVSVAWVVAGVFVALGMYVVGLAVWGNLGDWRRWRAMKKEDKEKARRVKKMVEHYGGG